MNDKVILCLAGKEQVGMSSMGFKFNYNQLVQAREQISNQMKESKDNQDYTKSMNEIGVKLL